MHLTRVRLLSLEGIAIVVPLASLWAVRYLPIVWVPDLLLWGVAFANVFLLTAEWLQGKRLVAEAFREAEFRERTARLLQIGPCPGRTHAEYDPPVT